MKVQEILRVKGTDVFSIAPTAMLREAVHQLVQHNCGSLLVTQEGTLLGIITERDILRASAEETASLDQTPVEKHMSTQLTTARPTDGVEDVMGLMTDKRIRHMPILDKQGKLAGMISIGDVVKAQHDQLMMENHHLKSYIHG